MARKNIPICLPSSSTPPSNVFTAPSRTSLLYHPMEGTFKFARIVLRPSGWYLQCICETETIPLPKKEHAIGLDMGIRYLVADSDGNVIENPKHAKKSAKKLAKAQRRLAKCQKGSHRRKKAKHQVARHHERIANQRKDTLHKASRFSVNGYQTIVIENLHPANMVRNHCLAFSIADASWLRVAAISRKQG